MSNALTNRSAGAPAQPRISVLVSTYNAEKYMRACLEDLERQTIAQQLEIIVIDSGSQQNEKAIVEEFQTRYSNIVYVRTEREKLYEAWNRGIRMAKGKYITNANSDDAHQPNALELLAAALDANPTADLAYGDYYNSYEPNDHYASPHILRRIAHPDYHPAHMMFFCCTGCHPMWRRVVFFKVGMFDTQYLAPGDYEFLLRAVKNGLRAVRVPEFLSFFYQNPKGLSFQSEERSKKEWAMIQAKYWAEMPIEKLYAVDTKNPESVAQGWIALGNLAMNIRHPWFDNYSQQPDVAAICYERALGQLPGHATALYNLAMARAMQGQLSQVETLLRLMAPEQQAQFIRNIKAGNRQVIPVEVPAAVKALEYRSNEAILTESKPAAPENKVEKSDIQTPVRWLGAFLTPTSLSRDAIEGALSIAPRLARFATREHSDIYSAAHAFELPEDIRAQLAETREPFNTLANGITITSSAPNGFAMPPDSAYSIARTTVETDGLPQSWAAVCNQMREVWAPSRFTLEAFAQSGVERHKLRVMPVAVDTEKYSTANAKAYDLPNRAAWNFLFCDDWSERAGYDALLKAYFQEFSERDDVRLYIASRLPGKTSAESAERIRQETRATAQKFDSSARFEVLTVAEFEMPGVLKACDAVILPCRAEGWGRQQLQALLMEKPLVTTGWGAHMDFCSEANCRLASYEMASVRGSDTEHFALRGQKWAEPSLNDLRREMREMATNTRDARKKAQGHREALLKFDRKIVGAEMIQRLAEIEIEISTPVCAPAEPRNNSVPSATGKGAGRARVNWEGSFLDFGSLSHVNRELTDALAKTRQTEVTRVGQANASAPQELKSLARRVQAQGVKNAEVTVRHAWPPNWEKPAAGAWVLIQPWEFGLLPSDWVKELANVDEVWAPSEYVRRVYVDSGVNSAKVKIVPNGIDPEKYRPRLEAWPLATQKKFKFLFVGGTIRRKGPDVLLKAYLETFTAADDVCLVIKDFGGQSVYQGQTLEKEIATARQNPNSPEILYLTDELPSEAMPRLYAACDCLAHPYRGEGFGLPVLEAMACGLPVIVTGGGATDDFAADGYAYRLPALRTLIGDKIGEFKLARNGWWLEPDAQALAERMRWVTTHRDEARALGAKASEYARREWTWERAAQIADVRLQDLLARKKTEKEAQAEQKNRKAKAVELPASALLGNLTAAQELFKRKEFGAAWKVTAEALEARPYHPEAYLLLAEIAKAAGNGAVSQRLARHAKELAPGWNPPKQFLKSGKQGGQSGSKPADLGLAETINEFKEDTTRTRRLTVCMIVKNEEQFIGQCLKSIKDIAWQIVVVDTGSTDRTAAIAKEHGAEIYEFKWQNDFGAARNAALERARGDWVLSLDADEELLPEHKETLQQEMRAAGTMAYRMPIIDKGREQEGSSFVPRLFRNAPGLFFLGRVHEQPFSSIEVRCQQWGLKHVIGKAALFHHGYTPELVKDRNKIERNLRLLELAIEEMPNEPNLLMNYGLELMRSGQSQEGLNHYLEALRYASELPASQVTPELRETLLTQLSTHLLQAKLFDRIVKIWQMPFAKAAAQTASQHFTLGLAYMELKKPELAAEQMRLCLTKREQQTYSPRNPEVLKAGPAHCLALCLATLHQTATAGEFFNAAIAIEPKARAPRLDFARFLAEAGKQLDALKWLNQLIAENQADLEVWRVGAQIAQSKPEFRAFACDWTGEAIKHFPQEASIIFHRAEALFLAERGPQALTFWKDARLPKQARSDAARILCEILLGRAPMELAPGDERAVSQEALKWYRRLIAVGAVASVHALNQNIETIRKTLPSFVAVWETATRKASAATASAAATTTA